MSSLQKNYRRKYDSWSYQQTKPGVDLAQDIVNENGFVVSSTSNNEDYGLDLDSFIRVPVEVEVSQVWNHNWTKHYLDIPYSKAIQIKNERGEFWQFNKTMTHLRVVHHTVIKMIDYEPTIRKGFGLKVVRRNYKHDGNEVYTQEPFYRISLDQVGLFAVLKYPGGK